ncbi:MAG: hypothetical protein ACYDEY_16660 [Acidimicrobiales bacterium]
MRILATVPTVLQVIRLPANAGLTLALQGPFHWFPGQQCATLVAAGGAREEAERERGGGL